MKRFGKIAFTLVLVLGLAFTMSACSSGGGGSSGGSGGVATAITTTTQGVQAASSSSQGASMAQGSSQTFQNLGNIGLSSLAPAFKTPSSFKPSPVMSKFIKTSGKFAKLKAAKAAASSIKKAAGMKAPATGSEACTDGGSVDYTVDVNSTTNTFTGTLTFSSCREDDSQYDGTYTMTGTMAASGDVTITSTLGSSTVPFVMMDFGNNYSTLITKTTLSGFSLGMSITQSASAGMSFSMSASGAMDMHDYINSEDYSLTFSNGYANVMAISAAGTSLTMTTNGNFSESWTAGGTTTSVAASFTNLQLAITVASTYEDMSLSGSFTITFTPASCLNGTFTFVTTTPIRYDETAGHPTQGLITINGSTTVQYHADGSITVTTGGISHNYNSEYDLTQVCPMATFDEPAPVSSGSTGTASTGGGNFTATLTWDGPGGTSTSDMDFHMNYYATSAPTASTVGTWYVDYSNMNPISGVSLDIDDVDGYGPEHITATTLPAGYYVISVDSYSLHSDTAASVNVTLQIGSSSFGPFSHTFTTSDGQGTDPASWFAVADMVVDSSGGVQVKAHNASLQLWHDGAFGMYAPRRAKGL